MSVAASIPCGSSSSSAFCASISSCLLAQPSHIPRRHSLISTTSSPKPFSFRGCPRQRFRITIAVRATADLSRFSSEKHANINSPGRNRHLGKLDNHNVGISPSYTSMSPDPLAIWERHRAHSVSTPPFLTAELLLLQNAATDRAEMHAILAKQRDNWNKLFQRTLTSTMMVACVLSALAGCTGAGLSLNLPAFMLNAGAASMMAIINQFQPSQLAEEQRTAVRLFRKIAADVHYALNVPDHLRQNMLSFYSDCRRRLHALDKAFPMPLTPGGLEKFPSQVVPTVLRDPQEEQLLPHQQSSKEDTQLRLAEDNGWNERLVLELKNVSSTLRTGDIPKYTSWATNVVKVNKLLAVSSPVFAVIAAILNMLSMTNVLGTLPGGMLGMWAAICGILATFLGSMSNDMQLGMVFELYRNSAGYYADLDTSITEMLQMPAEKRENGAIFRQRVAYQLGRWPCSEAEPMVDAAVKEAGTLF
ncbi:hypothetical protein KP509_1Z209400 [Ceratopteris richardii]|nr:hypothetical protein KP509_1Z209400 [Ceratopteris richardii]